MKGKEVKIGLSVIATLLCLFAAVLFVRLRDRDATPAVAAKQSSKAKNRSKKQDQAAGKGGQEQASSPPAKKPATFSRGGPSLKLEAPAARGSLANSSRGDHEQDARGVSSRPEDRSALAGPFGQNDAPGEEPAESVDRYGRRYGLANDLPADHANRYPEQAADETAADGATADEMPSDETPGDEMADDDAPSDDAGSQGAALSLGAGRDAGHGQPADGYRTLADETAQETAADAANDPFPSTSPAPLASRDARNQGFGHNGPLKPSAAEVRLAPIGDAANSGKAGFSAVSRQTAATSAAEPQDDADSLAASGSVDRSAVEEARDASGAYVVQASDSFATISKKVYGTESYFKALHEYNREQYPNPNMIDVGDEIAVPDVAVLQQNYPGLCPKPRGAPIESRGGGAMRLTSRANSPRGGRAYLVAEGDTLFDIAKRELGKASRWKEIYDLNQDQLGEDFNYLSPGTELMLPGGGLMLPGGGEKPDPVADRPQPGRRRR